MVELSGLQHIGARRETVWNGLNDARMLKASIPGCESLEPHGENGFAATVVAKVGPVRARFSGTVELSDVKAPESYTISFEGKGGAAGMAKGSAEVTLEDAGDDTLLQYTVKADVGGKLAAIGGRLLKSTIQKYAGDFFSRFEGYVTGAVPLPADFPTPAAAAGAPAAAPARDRGTDDNAAHLRRLNWTLLAIIVGLIVYILASR